ncbi:hypothetical protein QCA50_004175 [Cerrena zonata]|uniref:RING-type domain-containing protein n=1 Tax=Cerrena zonata TaxID=2478898 RepID=A0AAW0GTG2_9APHY
MSMCCPICGTEDVTVWKRVPSCGHMFCGRCGETIAPTQCPHCRAKYIKKRLQTTYLPPVDTSELDQLRRENEELKREIQVLTQRCEELSQAAVDSEVTNEIPQEETSISSPSSTVDLSPELDTSSEPDRADEESPSFITRITLWLLGLGQTELQPVDASLPSCSARYTDGTSGLTIDTESISTVRPRTTNDIVDDPSEDDDSPSTDDSFASLTPSSDASSPPTTPPSSPCPIQSTIPLPVPGNNPEPTTSSPVTASPARQQRTARPTPVGPSVVPEFPCLEGRDHRFRSTRGTNKSSRKYVCRDCEYFLDERTRKDANDVDELYVFREHRAPATIPS